MLTTEGREQATIEVALAFNQAGNSGEQSPIEEDQRSSISESPALKETVPEAATEPATSSEPEVARSHETSAPDDIADRRNKVPTEEPKHSQNASAVSEAPVQEPVKVNEAQSNKSPESEPQIQSAHSEKTDSGDKVELPAESLDQSLNLSPQESLKRSPQESLKQAPQKSLANSEFSNKRLSEEALGESPESAATGQLSATSVAPAEPRYVMGSPLTPKPDYPRIARSRGWEGEVIIALTIADSGQVVDAEIHRSSGYAILDRKALETLQQWRLAASSEGSGQILVPVRFELH
ncbi:energy transducer TonB [Hahella sp. CCB-MM4]|uniref:energy transducer TonB n=1 Tax=Hahella sp. (strain CCB-MM4) TaxID=1926491 RepID=UPI00143CC17B|nr:energy transducer TonB [Hahella sp. CCB-MM4]